MSLSQDHSVRYALAASLAGIATGLMLYGIYTSNRERLSTSRLHRSNAVSRRVSARHPPARDPHGQAVAGPPQTDGAAADVPPPLQSPHTPGPTIEADNSLTEDEYSSYPDADAEQVAANTAPGQHLRELAFAIASNNARTENTVHHGVGCDSCMENPIRGVRFKCANCDDFDLCEKCEAVFGHYPTHVLLKLRIPTRTPVGIPIPVWYPGNILELPQSLPDHLCRDLLKRYKARFEDADCRPDEDSLRASYERFVCLANVPYPNDSCNLGRGVDESAFACLITNMRRPSPIVSRLFRFYDILDHGILGFDELVYGSIVILHDSARSMEIMPRTFQCLDVDKDGFLSRQDLLRVFRAYFDFNQDTVARLMQLDADAEDLSEGSNAYKRHYIEGAGSLGAYYKEFSDDGPHFGLFASEVEEDGKVGAASRDITQLSAAERTWVPLEEELTEELERVTVKNAPDARFGVGRDVERAEGLPRPFVCLHGSRFFINLSSNLDQRPTYYVKLDLEKDHDLLDELWHKEMLYHPNDIDPDPETLEKIRVEIKRRLLAHIEEKRAARRNLRTRLNQLLPEDGTAIHGPKHSSSELEASSAVHAIVQEAFNELLDPIFQEREQEQARAERTLPVRVLLAAELDAFVGMLAELGHVRQKAGETLPPGNSARICSKLLDRLHDLHPSEGAWNAFVERVEALEALDWHADHFGRFDSVEQLELAIETARSPPTHAPPHRSSEREHDLERLAVERLVELAAWERHARVVAARGAGLDKLSLEDWEHMAPSDDDERGRGGDPALWKWMWSFLGNAVF